MSVDVICAGFGRTGTQSLKYALEQLGYGKCYHMRELFAHPGHAERWTQLTQGAERDWNAMFAGYRSVVDWPAVYFWRELVDYYPDAKVLLTVRDSDSWWESISSTIFTAVGRAFPDGATEPQLPSEVPDLQRQQIIAAKATISTGTFNDRVKDRDYCIGVYEAHNREVQEYIEAKRLLVYDVKSGWQPLCSFLGTEVPDEPFPTSNPRKDFHQQIGSPAD
ncbi:MAG TPA: sulfotransferase family protein [Gammaproteobacteria bacterium]|nr:sulfotransferase family protein [Gammaproteobacteria bacterium]